MKVVSVLLAFIWMLESKKILAKIDKAKRVPLASFFFTRVWPVTGLVAAAMLNLALIGFLGYGLFKLLEP
jgi:hypothetical protein